MYGQSFKRSMIKNHNDWKIAKSLGRAVNDGNIAFKRLARIKISDNTSPDLTAKHVPDHEPWTLAAGLREDNVCAGIAGTFSGALAVAGAWCKGGAVGPVPGIPFWLK